MPSVTFGFTGGGITVTVNADSTKAVPILRNNAQLWGMEDAQTAPVADVAQKVLDELVNELIHNSRRVAKEAAIPPVEEAVETDPVHDWDEVI